MKQWILALLLLASSMAEANDRQDYIDTWQAFKNSFIQRDGRVVELKANNRSISEAQAYSLFFALIANDKQTFERVLNWTENNLAQGDLTQHLPAWAWGKDKQGKWTVLDPNSASDADIWLAYTLLEAGRVWQSANYTLLGYAVLDLIAKYQVKYLEGVGTLLLPGRYGFVDQNDVVKINHSYVPFQVLRALAEYDENGPWRAIGLTHHALLIESSQKGFAANWNWVNQQGVMQGKDYEDIGSYDAIRVYLWLGLDNPAAPHVETRLNVLNGMQQYKQGWVPEQIHTFSADEFASHTFKSHFALGYNLALLPYWSYGQVQLAATQRLSRSLVTELKKDQKDYYQQALALFSLGWWHGQYNFNKAGRLTLAWN